MRRSTVIVCALILLLVPTLPQPTVAQEAEVRDIVEGLEDALNDRDWTAFGSYFSPRGDAILFDSRRAVGPEDVADLMSELWASIPDDVTASLVTTGVRLVTPDVAVANIAGTFEGSAPSRDRASLVLSRDEDRWVIDAFRVFPAEPER